MQMPPLTNLVEQKRQDIVAWNWTESQMRNRTSKLPKEIVDSLYRGMCLLCPEKRPADSPESAVQYPARPTAPPVPGVA